MDFKQASRLKIGQITNYKSSQFQTPPVPNSENTKSERGEVWGHDRAKDG